MGPAPIPDCIESPAVIVDKATLTRYFIHANELTWQKPIKLDPEQTEYDYLHIGKLNHFELGPIIFYAWENIKESIHFGAVRINAGLDSVKNLASVTNLAGIGKIKIVENFKTDPPYTFHTDRETSEERITEMMAVWFYSKYEEPAVKTPHDSGEGGYQWMYGGPYDANEEIGGKFLEFPEHLIEKAVNVVQADGTHDWALISPPENSEDNNSNADEHTPDIPDQTPYFAFTVNSAGQIDLAPGPGPSADENRSIQELRGQLTKALDKIIEKLAGSNAYPEIAEHAAQYRKAVVADPLSIDVLYAQGIWFENTIRRVNQDIAAGETPALAPEVGAALDMSLQLHGVVIASTARGRELMRLAEEYAASNVDNQAYRAAAQPLVEAVGQSTNLFTAEIINFTFQASSEIEEGEYPKRSSHIGRIVISNLLVAVGKIVTYVAPGIRKGVYFSIAAGLFESEAGATVRHLTRETANAALQFVANNIQHLRELANTAGPELQWLIPFLDWIATLL